MFKLLITTLALLWPILGSAESVAFAASKSYFYDTVMPSTEERAGETPLASPAGCLDPSSSSTNQVNRTIAFEVNGAAFCGGNLIASNLSTYYWWIITYNPGTRVKIRYAVRNVSNSFNQCSTSDPMYLWLKAPGMGISERYLNSGGGWSLIPTNFRNDSPAANVWNDLYDAVPPAGDYTLVIGCDSAYQYPNNSRAGEIRFKILGGV